MEKECGWLEFLQKKHMKDSSVAKVLAVDSEPAVGKGENFSSDILRIKLRVVLGSGVVANRSLILKRHPKLNRKTQKFLIEYHNSPIEIVMYSEIIPELDRLMLEYGDTSDKLWCECFSFKANDHMLLEDLKGGGFRNAERVDLLDLQHSLFVFRNVARLHAMSAVLLHKGRLQTERLQPYCMVSNQPMMNLLMSSGIRMLVRVMNETWGTGWEEAAEKLGVISDDVGRRMQELYEENPGRLVVLNHGDCWVNNMMFKHELGTNIPTAIRLVDLQESHFNSYGWDLTMIFQTSLTKKVREEHTDDVLQAYLDSLEAAFTLYGWTPDNMPSLREIKEELDRLFFYGFVLTSCALPFFMADPEDAMELDDLLIEEDPAKMDMKRKMYIGPTYTELIKGDLKRLLQLNLL